MGIDCVACLERVDFKGGSFLVAVSIARITVGSTVIVSGSAVAKSVYVIRAGVFELQKAGKSYQ
jgi:hypothetical protein